MKFVIQFAFILTILVAYAEAQSCPNQPSFPMCQGPRNVGHSRGHCTPGRRFFFDVNERVCRPMQFLGCGGNQNRFCTLAECDAACLRRL